MADHIESNKPTTSYKESSPQRSYLSETIANIYMLKGKANPEPVMMHENEENRAKLLKSLDGVLQKSETRTLEKQRRLRLGGIKIQRKQKRPRKLNSNRHNINFKMCFRNKSKLSKIRRGYLNEAAKKIKHEIEMERLLRRYNDGDFVICKAFKRFYENADDLMKQVRNLRYRARCALIDYSY